MPTRYGFSASALNGLVGAKTKKISNKSKFSNY
jgi:hypothetical protein